jgi:hypothetical protein
MRFGELAAEGFKRRPDAPRTGYIAALIVIGLFILAGHDEPLKGLWPYFILLLLCVVQLFVRTIAGWLSLIVLSSWYAIDVAVHPARLNGEYLDYVFFVACGAIPSILLWIFRPRVQASGGQIK